jgi:dihydropyrimidinase
MATDYSMFEGWKVFGNARHVFSRGEWVVKDAQWIGETGRGRFLKREANAGGFA